MARGFLDYFPKAMAEVAHISYIANEQHNPGEPMHWSKNKSADHADALVRHLAERGGIDTDGLLHTAKVAWRGMALLETELDTLTKQEQEALAKGRRRETADLSLLRPSQEAWDELKERIQAHADEVLLTSESPTVRTTAYELEALKGYPANASINEDGSISVILDTRREQATETLVEAMVNLAWTVTPGMFDQAKFLEHYARVVLPEPPAYPISVKPSLWERIREFVAHTFVALAFRVAPVDAWNAAQTESEMLYDEECSDEGF